MFGIAVTVFAVFLVICLALCYSDRKPLLGDELTNPGFSAKRTSKKES
jgi:hypothetical protein